MTPFNVAIVRWIRGAFDFRGRATRAEYWWPRLLVFVVNLVLLVLFLQGGGEAWLTEFLALSELEEPPESFADFGLPPLSSLSTFAAVFYVVFGVLTFVPDISVAVRRFHDLGHTGWLHAAFLLVSPLFVFVTLIELVWFMVPGQKHDNRYGPDPLGNQADVF